MKHSRILVVGAFFFALVSPTYSSAQSEPLPGKWEKSFAFFVFDNKTETYVPFMLQSHDNDIHTECLSRAYFREKSFHTPAFRAKEQDRPGRRCVVSNEGQTGSGTTWQQVCTDPNGSTEDERWLISISSDKLVLETNNVTTNREAGGLVAARNKAVIKFKRIGECDTTPEVSSETLGLPKTLPTQLEQAASDRRYEARDGGVVRDTKTGLEWTQSDNGSEINWGEAMKYCADKDGGWRLGSPDELESLFDTSQSSTCGDVTCKVSAKFRLSASWFWSNELKRAFYAWTVYLHVGGRYAHHVNPRYYTRALCVRRI